MQFTFDIVDFEGRQVIRDLSVIQISGFSEWLKIFIRDYIKLEIIYQVAFFPVIPLISPL